MSLFKKNYTLIYFIFFILIFLLFLNINSFAEEEVLEFPYDPEEKATEMKMCAKVCLRRRDVCVKREKNNPDAEQICQSQMIMCINQCR